MEPEPAKSSLIPKPMLGVLLLIVMIPALMWLSRLPFQRDLHERKSVRNRGAAACVALARPSAGLAEVQTAADAFQDDRQLVLGLAARRVLSALRAGSSSPESVADLGTECLAIYQH